jgi:ParB family protein of integrating conjugative element (PFGI_1 class)
MSRRSVRDLAAAFTAPVFGQPARELPPADPPVATLIEVEVDAIQPYDLNPRRQENPEFFARLCDSILHQGLDNPIPITRRPGANGYMVAAGGNTRLKALKWLREQHPGESRFAKVKCIFKPYISEIDLIAAHLRENDLRDALFFIDHATAVMALKRRLEQDAGAELSQKEFVRRLEALGHKVSLRDVRRMGYAVECLDEAIPVALRHNLGPRAIDLIRNLHKFYGIYWDTLDPSVRGTVAFDPLFLNMLTAHDGETIALEAFRDSLDGRLMEVTGIPANRIRAEVESLAGLSGRGDRASDRLEAPTPPASMHAPAAPVSELAGPASPVPEFGAAERDGSTAMPAPAPSVAEAPAGMSVPNWQALAAGDSVAQPALEERPCGAEVSGAPTEHPAAQPELPADAGSPLGQAPEAARVPPAKPAAGPAPDAYLNPEYDAGRKHLPKPDDRKSLRSRVVVLATQAAQAAGLQDLVQADRESPAGFAVLDLPAGASERETALWWLLKALSAGRGFDFVPPSAHAFVCDPAAFAGHFLFRLDNGCPPPDTLLRQIFLLIESIVAVARAEAASPATINDNDCP